MLVTGADGFTGQHFIRHAVEAGYTVHSLKSDLTNPSNLKAEVLAAKPEMVVHLAAISFVGHADPSAFYNVNVVGTTNLLDALLALDAPPKKILLASSANVYGNTNNSPIIEEELPAPVNHYAMSKLAMEYMAKTYLDRLPIFFTRPFNYIGPGQDESFVVPKVVKHFASRLPLIELGNLDVEREFNDIRFVVEVYLRLLKHAEIGQTYNICSGNVFSLRHVIKSLSEITSHHIEVKVNPAFVRSNEIKRLSGSPDKLFELMKQDEIGLPKYAFEETLMNILSCSQKND
jgi:nucleoside-diphosphate-sugar epimerase